MALAIKNRATPCLVCFYRKRQPTPPAMAPAINGTIFCWSYLTMRLSRHSIPLNAPTNDPAKSANLSVPPYISSLGRREGFLKMARSFKRIDIASLIRYAEMATRALPPNTSSTHPLECLQVGVLLEGTPNAFKTRENLLSRPCLSLGGSGSCSYILTNWKVLLSRMKQIQWFVVELH